jgi:hypothetical protein
MIAIVCGYIILGRVNSLWVGLVFTLFAEPRPGPIQIAD